MTLDHAYNKQAETAQENNWEILIASNLSV